LLLSLSFVLLHGKGELSFSFQSHVHFLLHPHQRCV
jgi:hypothetical protein